MKIHLALLSAFLLGTVAALLAANATAAGPRSGTIELRSLPGTPGVTPGWVPPPGVTPAAVAFAEEVRAVPELPPPAREAMDAFIRESAAAHAEVEAKLQPKRKELIAQLRTLQDRYTKEGKLDEAVAIRERVRQLIFDSGGDLNAPLPDPGNLTAYRNRVGQSFHFNVTSARAGEGVWGTDTYTDDSQLNIAIVHAGIVQPNEETVVKVTVLPGQASYKGSDRNGVTSNDYPEWPGSYKVEAVPGAKVYPRPEPPARGRAGGRSGRLERPDLAPLGLP